jgi:hypothetical protein
MVLRVLAAAIGALLLVTGATLVYVPAGFVTAGVLLLLFGLLFDDGTAE